MRCFEGLTNSMELSLGKLREMVKDRELSMLQSMGLQGVRQHLVTEQQQYVYKIKKSEKKMKPQKMSLRFSPEKRI